MPSLLLANTRIEKRQFHLAAGTDTGQQVKSLEDKTDLTVAEFRLLIFS